MNRRPVAAGSCKAPAANPSLFHAKRRMLPPYRKRRAGTLAAPTIAEPSYVSYSQPFGRIVPIGAGNAAREAQHSCCTESTAEATEYCGP